VTTTITAIGGGGNTVAHALTEYRAERRSRNIIHEVAGGGTAVTLYGAGARSGRIELQYLTDAAAMSALALLALKRSFTLASTDRPAVNMTFAVDENSITLTLDSATKKFWLVGFGFQEVTP